jgi:acyl carrier protein
MGLESVELVMAWEEHFGIDIPNEVAAKMETPRGAIASIEKILQAGSLLKRQWTHEEIERDVCEIIVEQIGIRRKDFTLDSYFIRDMGVD